MSKLDAEEFLFVPYLQGMITEAEFREKTLAQSRDLNRDLESDSKNVFIYVAMKRYADEGPAAAINVLESYMQQWGTAPPHFGKPEFIKSSMKRLREELAAQPDEPGVDDVAP